MSDKELAIDTFQPSQTVVDGDGTAIEVLPTLPSEGIPGLAYISIADPDDNNDDYRVALFTPTQAARLIALLAKFIAEAP